MFKEIDEAFLKSIKLFFFRYFYHDDFPLPTIKKSHSFKLHQLLQLLYIRST